MTAEEPSTSDAPDRHLGSREHDRSESVSTYPLEPVADYAHIVELAAHACETPAAFVSVVEADRLSTLAAWGDNPSELPPAQTLSSWVIDNVAPLVVDDARADVRFDQSRIRDELVRSYAGVPLIGRDGMALGVLSVTDTTPRRFQPAQVKALETLGQSVVNVLELSRLLGAPSGAGRRLRRALDRHELTPWFQPIVRLTDRRPQALEALLRWEHPLRGVVPTREFLPDIATSGLALPVGRHVLHTALRTLADLRTSGEAAAPLRVAVNVSTFELAQPGLATSVLADLEAHRISPADLCLEITEQGVLDNPTIALRNLASLREAGVGIALDDFGTGRAGLRHLLEMPITRLKLDGSLIARLGEPRAQTILRWALSLSADLGVAVTAEGIETPDQRDLLLSLGCAYGQGHLFSAAVPASDLPALLGVLTSPVEGTHRLCLADRLVTTGADLLTAGLVRGAPVALLASTAHRVEVEHELAVRGIVAVQHPSYRVCASPTDVPAGSIVWTDLAGSLWQQGDVAAAIDLEDQLARLPAAVHCGHTPHALQRHGTEQQVRRLHEQHGVSVKVGLERTVTAGARALIQGMAATGSSRHSIAAALNAAGHPTPFGIRWHWKQIERVLHDPPAPD